MVHEKIPTIMVIYYISGKMERLHVRKYGIQVDPANTISILVEETL